MKHYRKLAITLAVLIVAVISLICIQLVTQKSKTNEQSGQIYLYGEEHASKAILEEEFELWNTYYHDNGMRDLFVELPYYSAEFLNLWMKSDNDDILEQQQCTSQLFLTSISKLKVNVQKPFFMVQMLGINIKARENDIWFTCKKRDKVVLLSSISWRKKLLNRGSITINILIMCIVKTL